VNVCGYTRGNVYPQKVDHNLCKPAESFSDYSRVHDSGTDDDVCRMMIRDTAAVSVQRLMKSSADEVHAGIDGKILE